VKNRLLIYFFYDKDGIVDDYVTYFLQAFKPYCKEICVVVNGFLTENSKDKLSLCCNNLLIRHNEELDVGAYKHALNQYRFDFIRENFDELILTNFTMYGPFFSLDEMFKNIDSSNCDFWGPFKWYIAEDKYRHIPSFLNVYKKNILKSNHFKEYWDNMPYIETYSDSVSKHEQKQTKHWISLGFKEGVWIDDSEYQEYWNKHWPLYCADSLLIENRFPFVKRRVFYLDNFQLNIFNVTKNILEFIDDKTFYDVNLIIDNLKRTQGDKFKNYKYKLKYYKYKIMKVISISKNLRKHYKDKFTNITQTIAYIRYIQDFRTGKSISHLGQHQNRQG
jgi:lipopolysaccharide biosynthesis protein